MTHQDPIIAAIPARLAALGARPTVPTALFLSAEDRVGYTERRDLALAKSQAWDAGVKHVVCDAVRTVQRDLDLWGLARVVGVDLGEDGSVDRRALADAIMHIESAACINSAAALAALFVQT